MQMYRLLIIGFVLVLAGAVLPFLMVLRVIEPSFLMSFVSYAASVGGVFLGVLGVAQYVGTHRQRDQDEYDWRDHQ